jgi:dihydroflavonol-4-reductase
MTTCVVTGAGGLIGAHIVRALLDEGHSVRALVRPGGSRDGLADLPVECQEADVLDPNALLSACGGCELAFHAAAYFTYEASVRSGDLHALAAVGSENVLRAAAAAGVRRVIVTSSSVVFGYRSSAGAGSINETNAMCFDQQPAYVAAKVAQHLRTLSLARQLGIDVVLACPTITVGPTAAALGASNGLIVAYLNDALRCTYPGGCNIVAARDVGRGHVLLAEQGAPSESYLLGSENLTWHDIHVLIAELAGVPEPAFELNHTMAFLAATAEEVMAGIRGRAKLSTREQAAMIGRYYWYSHAKAASLGYAPASARAALIHTISWLAASPHISREVRVGLRLSEDVYRLRAALDEAVVATR